MDVLKIITIIAISIAVFYVLGIYVNKLFHGSFSGHGLLLVGFFVYFSLFQMLYLPMMFSQQRLTVLAKVWAMVIACILLAGLWQLKGRKKLPSFIIKHGNKGIAIILVLLLLLQLFFMLTNEYNGWDTLYYIGQMNTAISTDSMYIYEGTHGLKTIGINLRYALSGFYMHGSVWSYLLGLHPLLYCRYVTPFIGWLLSNMIIYEIGAATIAKDEEDKRRLFVMFVCLINLFWNSSIYTTSTFLLTRSLEAKSYCSNVIIPAMFLAAVRLRQDWFDKDHWLYLFIVSFAANAVSFSSVLIIPIMLTVICIAGVIVERKKEIVRNYLLCMIVPLIYCIVYFLYVQGVIAFVW